MSKYSEPLSSLAISVVLFTFNKQGLLKKPFEHIKMKTIQPNKQRKGYKQISKSFQIAISTVRKLRETVEVKAISGRQKKKGGGTQIPK